MMSLHSSIVLSVLACVAVQAVAAAAPSKPAAARAVEAGRVVLESSDSRLEQRFAWARKQALLAVHDTQGFGPWYISVPWSPKGAPGSFCTRDVAHAAAGAQLLGLAAHTKNMLRAFAHEISDGKDWATFDCMDVAGGRGEYTDDRNFGINLPANFDVLRASYRQYLWTADPDYLNDAVFLNFYRRTVTDYVTRWDRDGDGLMDGRPQDRYRGTPGYSENLALAPLMRADLVAAQYAGYRSYASILRYKGDVAGARTLHEKALLLKSLFNSDWWSERLDRHYSAKLQDGSFYAGWQAGAYLFPFWFDQIPEEGHKAAATLDYLASHVTARSGVEILSYLPWVLYQYGRNERAYPLLLEQIDPERPHGLDRQQGYPEVAFGFLGSVAEGLMGLSPDASTRQLHTLSRLSDESMQAALKNVPVFDNEVSITHVGRARSLLTNQRGGRLYWKASFYVPSRRGEPGYCGGADLLVSCAPDVLMVDGAPVKAEPAIAPNGGTQVYVVVPVEPGQTRTVQVP